jgi:hypothetical protein
MHHLLGFGQKDVPSGLVGRPCRSCDENAASQPYKATGLQLRCQHLRGQTGRDQQGAGRGLRGKNAGCGGAHDPSVACLRPLWGVWSGALWITAGLGVTASAIGRAHVPEERIRSRAGSYRVRDLVRLY